MPPEASWRAALDGFVASLKELYGERLDSVILYGSRARGEGDDFSDVDTLVVLDPCDDFWTEFERIGAVASRLSLEHDVVISALPVDLREYRNRNSPLLMNARREGVRVG